MAMVQILLDVMFFVINVTSSYRTHEKAGPYASFSLYTHRPTPIKTSGINKFHLVMWQTYYNTVTGHLTRDNLKRGRSRFNLWKRRVLGGGTSNKFQRDCI